MAELFLEAWRTGGLQAVVLLGAVVALSRAYAERDRAHAEKDKLYERLIERADRELARRAKAGRKEDYEDA